MDISDVNLSDRSMGNDQDQSAEASNVQPTTPSLPDRRVKPTELVYLLKQNQEANRNRNEQSSVKRRTYSSRKMSQHKPQDVSDNIQSENTEEILLRLSNEFQPIWEEDWDTVIWIGPPPQEHYQDDHVYDYIKQHFSKPYLLDSQTLKNAKSAQFDKYLGPMSVRAERRLKKIGVHHLLPNDRKPKYFIDLRPMQDEDEALLMITELTCTPGVLSWHLSHLASGIPKSVIGGKDELNVTSISHGRSWMEVEDAIDDSEDENTDNKKDAMDDNTTGILELEPEYSALRHHMSIERLLYALVGKDPQLNSAAKVWTYFSIAKFFDCATNSKVNTWIYDWLFANNNSNFIQANPETAYRMALGMRSSAILRPTFAMLVGERALMQAGRSSSESLAVRSGASSVSVHGRNICHLDDDEVNRIDHAAHSLTTRMMAFFDYLSHGPLNWLSGSSELAKFIYIHQNWNGEEDAFIEEAFAQLRDYVRGEVFQALTQNIDDLNLMRLYRGKGYGDFGWLNRSRAFADAYNSMPVTQRILTQSFWAQLENNGLYQESATCIAWSRNHSLNGLNDLAPDLGGELFCVSKNDLANAIESMNVETEKSKQWYRQNCRAWRDVVGRGMIKNSEDGEDIDWWNSEQRTATSRRTHEPLDSLDGEVVRALTGLQAPAASPNRLYTPADDADVHVDGYSSAGSQHYVEKLKLTVHIAILLAELTMEMRRQIMSQVLTPGYVKEEFGLESEIATSRSDILVCLNDEEWKYLPLWAGGLDDGTGGVFTEVDVPDMEAIEGFRGGKIGLSHVASGEGSVDGSFTMVDASEDFDEVMTDEGVSTVGKASRIATDGTTSAGASTVISLDE